MLLKKITLINFRQFYCRQEILISYQQDQNVTLIHAENGVGKTTILNAILWCFYKETTARFEQPDKIANNAALEEGICNYKVEILFENDGNDYLVTRECDERTGQENFKAFAINEGNYVELTNPTAFVNSVVPEEMAKYFFFDGEYAETFSSQSNKSKVRDALEDMLGCRTANLAIKDLNSLHNEIEKQVAALSKNNQAETFQNAIDILEAQNDKDSADLILLEDNLSAAQSVRDEIIEKLRGAEAASTIQKQRETYERELARLHLLRKRQESELTSWINDGGIGLISRKLEDKTQEMLEDAKLKGKIPSYIAETFVNDILDKKVCICDRSFEEHSHESDTIRHLLLDAGTALATDRLMNARALMAKLSEKRSKSLPTYQRIKLSIEDIVTEISAYESKLEECSAKLKGSAIQEISERENSLEKRHEEIAELTSRITRVKHDREGRNSSIEDHKKKRDKMLQNDQRAIGLQKRAKILKKTVELIELELLKYRETSRNVIAEEVNRILDKTARRDYKATIDEKFNLDMRYASSSISVARSGGENQLLSLAFIAALIKFSSERMESLSDILKPGTTAPLVLDSPFGQLDPTYQQATASFLPRMARQVILLVSQTQGNPDVMGILKPKIGREYVLVSENTMEQNGKPSDLIQVNGIEIPSSRYGCQRIMTRIEAFDDRRV